MADRPLIGRTAELSRLRRLLRGPADPAGPVLTVLGDIGSGKSALLSTLAGDARAAGMNVLLATGRETESELPFTGLHQLLGPVLTQSLSLPGHLGEVLAQSLSLRRAGTQQNQFRTGQALLELLRQTGSAAGSGTLVLADDADRLDEATLEALGFTARRLDGARVSLVLAARGAVPPAPFGQGLPQLVLGPLSTEQASELLDGGPRPPRGRLRAQLLTQAAGNPLTLVELAQAAAAGSGRDRSAAGLPLPPTDRLAAVFARGLAQLPAATRQALLLVAAGQDDREYLTRAVTGLDPGVLAPAEEIGCITVQPGEVRFTHPAIASVVYHAAPPGQRASAHRQLADALLDQPDRRAWHLSAAADGPDERIAALLRATARRTQRRSGTAAMALALERAAQLSSAAADRAGCLVAAAAALVSAGQTEWAADLAVQAREMTPDGPLRARAAYLAGSAAVWSGRYSSAGGQLLPLAAETARRDPATAWQALALSATAAYMTGSRPELTALAGPLAALPAVSDEQSRSAQLWVMAMTGRHQAAAAAELSELLGRVDLEGAVHVGTAAWLLDQSALAVESLRTIRSTVADPAERAVADGPLGPLGWACWDTGRWDDALTQTADLAGRDITTAPYNLVSASIAAARGHGDRARAEVGTALAATPEYSRLVITRARHALALAALAEDNPAAAFDLLRQQFGDDGTPSHPHASYLSIGDLAAAAAGAGHRRAGAELLAQVRAVLDREALLPRSPRLRQQLIRADGMLADPADADAYPGHVIDDPATAQWPFERAQLLLEYGQWLRRGRRIKEAKAVLTEAHAAFGALQARPWLRQARTELRACGVAVPGSRPAAGGFAQLTPQQQQIARLAAAGLSNQDIGERLFLSPRTVASHLYRCFPKLGITDRQQLRDLVPAADRA